MPTRQLQQHVHRGHPVLPTCPTHSPTLGSGCHVSRQVSTRLYNYPFLTLSGNVIKKGKTKNPGAERVIRSWLQGGETVSKSLCPTGPLPFPAYSETAVGLLELALLQWALLVSMFYRIVLWQSPRPVVLS